MRKSEHILQVGYSSVACAKGSGVARSDPIFVSFDFDRDDLDMPLCYQRAVQTG